MIKEFQNRVILETKRLILRKINEKDFDLFHEMQSDIKVMQYTTMRALTKDENKQQLEEVISNYDKEDASLYVWAIETQINSFIGTAALVKITLEQWEIGYRLLPEFWANGYGQEITDGLIKLCRSIPSIHEVIATSDVRNTASNKILLNCGFDQTKKEYNEEYKCVDYHYKISVR